jgi:hypothetical protein
MRMKIRKGIEVPNVRSRRLNVVIDMALRALGDLRVKRRNGEKQGRESADRAELVLLFIAKNQIDLLTTSFDLSFCSRLLCA